MAQLGADVEQLDRMAAKFEQHAGQIEDTIRILGGEVESVWWEGSDAQRFKSDWNGTHRSNLQRLCQELRQTAGQVKKQAAQQRQTSQA
ncbi:MAG: hypothetical protein HKN91_07505 [Acidimicrobiia bacterium]|nr:hypothetical protein [Acidimicrobiia bacterium]